MKQAFRVLKPGGYALVWAIPRTSHWTATALENAGFEIRDRIHDIAAADDALANFAASLDEQQRDALVRIIEGQSSPILLHLFGSGFPKSKNISAAIDEHFGVERKVIEVRGTKAAGLVDGGYTKRIPDVRTAPGTALAELFDGWGTALGPAAEHWILARKPLIGTLAVNALAHRTGGINVDGCRVQTADDRTRPNSGRKGNGGVYGESESYTNESHPLGRWPKNVTLAHSANCIVGILEAMGTEHVAGPELQCVPECPLYLVDRQSGRAGAKGDLTGDEPSDLVQLAGNPRGRKPSKARKDKGGASRFFYSRKPSRSEREYGCSGLPIYSAGAMTDREEGSEGLKSPRAGAGRTGGARNFHPTLKSIELMRWLVRLVTPKGGTVLDCFTGSGTTGIAALLEGMKFVGVDNSPEYMPITRARISQALADTAHMDKEQAA